MNTWTIKPHYKGRTFNTRKITFPFDVTGCIIEMDFKLQNSKDPVFLWSTIDNTLDIISSTEVLMTERILDVPVNSYISDLKITFPDGKIYTQFFISLQVLKSITE